MKNNLIGIKLFFQTLLGVADNQKLTATEFNTLPAWQNSPVQQIAGSLDDTDIIIDGTKNYATTIVVAGATRTITANASGHLQGNNIKQRYTFNVDCTLTLSGFDTPGNNTGDITPIPAGIYDFQYFSNRNGVNVEIAQNTNVANFTEPSTWYVHSAPEGNDSNVGSANFPFVTIQHAHDTAAENDTIVIQDIFFSQPSSPGTSITKDITIKGVITNISTWTRLKGIWTVSASVLLRLESLSLFSVTIDGPGNIFLYLTNCATHNLKTGSTRVILFNSQSSIISLAAPSNYFSVLSYDSDIDGDVSVGGFVKLFGGSLITGNVTSGIDGAETLIVSNSTIDGNVINTGNLIKKNGIITGTETVSGTTTSRQAKVFDDNVEFKGQATVEGLVISFSATPTFNFSTGTNNQQMPVEGNVTTFATSNELNAGNYDVWLVNDATPGRTVAAPTGWTLIPGGDTHDDSANAINLYQFKVSPSGLKRYIIKNM